MPFPGIPRDLLAALEEPNPLDVGLLRQEVEAFADPPDGPLGALLDYGRLLLAANQVVNLTGAKDWPDLIEGQWIDCLRAARFVPQDARVVVDWGSGAGLPGLVWAILFPEKRLLLAERTGKKAAFLEEAAVRLDLPNVEVLGGQAEELLRQSGEKADLVVARAVEPLPRLLGRLRRNRVRHGVLFVMTTPRFAGEWEAMSPAQRASWALAARHPYELPGGRGERVVAVFKPR